MRLLIKRIGDKIVKLDAEFFHMPVITIKKDSAHKCCDCILFQPTDNEHMCLLQKVALDLPPYLTQTERINADSQACFKFVPRITYKVFQDGTPADFRMFSENVQNDRTACEAWLKCEFNTKREAEIYAYMWAYPFLKDEAADRAPEMEIGKDYDYSTCNFPMMMKILEVNNCIEER